MALVALAALAGGTSFSEAAGRSSAGELQVRMLRAPSIAAAPGSLLSIPVELVAQGDEQDIRFSLKFDSSALAFVRAEPGAQAQGAFISVDDAYASSGSIGVSIDLIEDRHFEAGTNHVINLLFLLDGSRTGHRSALEFTDFPVARSITTKDAENLETAFTNGTVAIAGTLESDVAPRTNGDGNLTIGDWVQAGRFAAKIDNAGAGSEFQSADSAPRATFGDGQITLADWVQAGRYTQTLDPSAPTAGPTAPPGVAESAPAGTSEQAQGLVVRVVNTTFTRGQDNTLDIQLDAQGSENAVAFTLNYDPNHMTFVGATLGSGVPANSDAVLNLNNSQLSAGKIGMALALRGGVNFGTGTKQLVVVRFTVPTLGNQNSSNVSFTNDVLAREVVDTNASSLTGTFTNGTVAFTPTVNSVPIISTIAPSFVTVGGPAFTLIVIGSDFVNGASVRIDGNDIATNFVSAGELQAFVPASLIAQTAVLEVSVRNPAPGGGVSATLFLSVNNPVPVLIELTPNIVGVNTGGFVLRVRGTNFAPGAMLRVRGEERQTTVISSTELTAAILPTDINELGSASITVRNPEPGGGVSNELLLLIVTPSGLPRLTSLEPESKVPGSTAFTLVLNGTNFAINAVVTWSGSARPTHFIDSTRLTADISAADVAVAGTFQVRVVNPPPGGGNSNLLPFVVAGTPNPVPTLTAINPTQVTSGGPEFNLVLTGTNFVESSLVLFNNVARQTTFISATELRAVIFGSDIATGGLASITVSNPPPGGGVTAPQILTINLGVPAITLLSPSSALAGGPAFNLGVTGTSFAPGSIVRWNGSDRTTEFISGTELRAAITAADIAAIGTATVSVFSPPPGGGISNGVTFTIRADNNPLPRIDTLTPSQGFVNGTGFTLTVVGTGFVEGSSVRWDGAPRPTVFVDSTRLTAAIPASDLTSIRTVAVTVFNSTPGGGNSNPVNFSIVAQPPTAPQITTITPNSVNAGGQAFALAVEGANFNESSVVQFNSSDRVTQFVNTTQLIAQLTAEDVRFGGVATINVINRPNGGTSNVVQLTILNPVPTITGTDPTILARGSAATTLRVLGTNFGLTMVVLVNGQPRDTTVVSPTLANVLIPASDMASLGTLTLIARNPIPGGGDSNAFALQVVQSNPLPRLDSITPNSANAGGPAFSLVAQGTSFVPGSIVRFGTRDLQTEYISATNLVAQVTPADLQLGGEVPVRVINPAPGGGNSGAVFFSITTLPPTITSVTPNPIVGGPQPVAVTVDGTNFAGATVVRFNGVAKQTQFVSGTRLVMTLQPFDLVGITSAVIEVFTPPPGGGTSNSVTVSVTPTSAPVPAITSLNPAALVVGSGATPLNVIGTQFFPTTVVQVNGTARPTSFVSPTELQMTLTAQDLQAVTTLSISAFTPGPGGGTSNAVTFAVVGGAAPAPVLVSLQPTVGLVGTPFILTVNGTNIQPQSVIQVNGQSRGTSFISGTQLSTQLTASDVAGAGQLSITIFTPAPGGGTSNALSLAIVAETFPTPLITSLEPAEVTAGGAAFGLIVNGDGFRAGSVVRVNGQNRPTTINNTTQLVAQLSANDISIPGQLPITVFNPSPGGGLSNTLVLLVSPLGPPQQCREICWAAASYWDRNPGKWPSGVVLVGGVNGNAPIPISPTDARIQQALEGGSGPLQQLNQQYVAWQFNFLRAGGNANAAKSSNATCYSLEFAPFTLTNLETISTITPLGTIEAQVRLAIQQNRVDDYIPLANVMRLFNGDDSFDACFRPGTIPSSTSFSGGNETPAILRRRER